MKERGTEIAAELQFVHIQQQYFITETLTLERELYQLATPPEQKQ